MRSLQQFWSVRRIGEDKVTLARLGPLRLWLARADQEWGFTTHYGEDTDLMDFAKVPEDVVPEDLVWTYAFFKSAPRDYIFEAMPPTLPILLRFDSRIGIPCGESCTFYFSVPTRIAIRLLDNDKKRELGSIDSLALKQTWYGSTVGGRLCLANRRGMVLQQDDLDTKPNEIVCPLKICNQSNQMIWPQKVCLDLQPVGIYCGSENLFAGRIELQVEPLLNECRLRYLDIESPDGQDLLELRPPSEHEYRDRLDKILCCCQNLKDH